jgi:hypothetical protein
VIFLEILCVVRRCQKRNQTEATTTTPNSYARQDENKVDATKNNINCQTTKRDPRTKQVPTTAYRRPHQSHQNHQRTARTQQPPAAPEDNLQIEKGTIKNKIYIQKTKREANKNPKTTTTTQKNQ